MQIEQIYTGCLAQGAYYITSNGEAVIIDPLREIQPYLKKLENDGVQLKYIIETHFHADFVSGHLDLAKATGAQIIYGPTAEPKFECIIAKDNQVLQVGDIQLKILHTPGHTMESITILLIDKDGKDHCIFSGDTLFLGDVGRPDLAQKAGHLTQEDLAGYLYNSLMTKIMPLADDVIVYPAHGAGSSCGKNMMKETVDTLGNQKKMNYALNQPNKEAFIEAVLDGLTPPPAYFGANVAMNKSGYKNVEEVIQTGLTPLSPVDFEAVAEQSGALILDTRHDTVFWKGFVPNSVNIGLGGSFAPLVGSVIGDVNQKLLLVTDKDCQEEAIIRLSRVGFDNVLGYLDGGFEAWETAGKEVDKIDRITANEFEDRYNKTATSKVVDVRQVGEYNNTHIEGAELKTLQNINDWIGEVNAKEHFFVHCQGGYRSMTAASILQARGYRNFTEVEGGMNAIKKTNLPQKSMSCQN